MGVGVGPAGSGVSVGSAVEVMVGTGVGGDVGLVVGTDIVDASVRGVDPADWPARTTGVASPPLWVGEGAGGSEGIKTARVGRGWREVQPADRVSRIAMKSNQGFARPNIK